MITDRTKNVTHNNDFIRDPLMTVETKPLILVDGSSYLYRAFHALPALKNSKGQPTGAIYGMVSMLKRLLADYRSDQIAVIFDTKGKTFRDDLFPAYKATRKEMPDDLIQQVAPLHDIIKAMGFPLIAVEGVEADDVIGTLSKQATASQRNVLVSTGDKDLAQLVNPHITLVNTMTNTVLNPEGVFQKFGVRPDQIIDYLTLIGDTSDNIPGVPQVGPKTAAKWLQDYDSLDNLVQHVDELKGKVGQNLKNALTQLELSRSLVTIKCDVELPLSLNDLSIASTDRSALIHLFKDMEFKNWLNDLLADTQQQEVKKVTKHYDIILDENQFNHWINLLEQTKLIAIDIETNHFDYMQAQLVGISFAIAENKAAYIPFAHDYEQAPLQLTKELVLSRLKPILENQAIKKIGQHIKYAIEVLANAGIDLQGVAYDTMLESHMLDSTGINLGTDTLALKYLGIRTIPYEEIAGKGAKQISFNQIEMNKAAEYAAEKADITFRLHQELWSRIQQNEKLINVLTKIEMPLTSVLAEMERHGVLIDPDKLKKQGEELQARVVELEKHAYVLAGTEFNMNSPKQLQEILFETLHLPILQKTPTGQPSTADAVLQELALEFELPKIIIEYRSLSKLISTYTNRLAEQINPQTKRIHTSYHQTITATGRLSSSEPNLQNIPIRSPEGRRIRQAFIAAKGYQLVSADYSQIELRIMAHMSEDPSLLNAFANNLDIHVATAAEVWEVPLDQVTFDMRRNAKAINFGLIYGMSAFGLTRQLGIDRKSAQDYIDKYFARYPNVKAYMENTRLMAKEKGYVETLWGRRLYLPEINASQMPRQKAAERAAINAPLQGSAADIIKMAMLSIQNWLQQENIPAAMIMQVHDELVFEVAESAVPMVVKAIQTHMSQVVTLKVPLLVSVGTGYDWDKASEH